MKNTPTAFRLLLLLYPLLCILFIIYSYTQVDLNLTLWANPLYQSLQQPLTRIGYYSRPLSAALFLFLMLVSGALYITVLLMTVKNRLNQKYVWWLIGVTGILLLAYPAFSHDIFNYMFDARIVTTYGLDPHFFKALDFPLDPWTRFMRWTHRYYPYGSGWLLVSLVPSWLGMGKFVVTLFFFKLTFLLFHIANCKLIGKILAKISPAGVSFGLALFAFNPLVLTESIVSPHNEVLMLTLALLAIYLLQEKRVAGAVLALISSAGIKFVSGILLPLFWWKKAVSPAFIIGAYLLWAAVLLPVIYLRELYAWYLVPLVGLAALTSSRLLQVVTIGISAGILLRYFPFLLLGEYGVRTTTLGWWVMGAGTAVMLLAASTLWRK